MKTQKGLLVLATVSLLGLSVACNDRYQEGFDAGKAQGYTTGYDAGYDDGYLDGDEAGFERAKTYFASADYNAGFADGKTAGIAIGYTNGYNVGKTDGVAIGYTNGYNVGYDDGYDDGSLDGYDQGYDDGNLDGYDNGYDDGMLDGYDLGYDDGFEDGYDVGYDDGFDDGYGLSVGKTASLKGYSNLISMVHNDLIDYSKIKAPKQTAKGLVANGKLILAETSLTNKDTLKRAAAVEQYLVVEMSKQVSKLGLSAERSLKIAKAANHFRKFSSKAALTAADTNAYASEIIGSDIASLSKAAELSMKGDSSSFNAAMEKAAAKNGTSSEKMSEIVSKLFL